MSKASTKTRSKAVGRRSSIPTRTSPLRWWRTIAPRNVRVPALRVMETALSKVAMLGEARWRDAVAGDAAAAIAIALSARHEETLKFDLAMTALVVCGRQGSAAACIVLANLIERMPGAGELESDLATSWLDQGERLLPARYRGRKP